MAVGVAPGIIATRELAAMREEFPIESLASRLEYERRERAATNKSDPALSQSVTLELVNMENQLDMLDIRHSRISRLRQLHSRQYELFVRANGFGIGRMSPPRLDSLRRPPLNDVPFNIDSFLETESEFDSSDYRSWEIVGPAYNIEHLHGLSRYEFANPNSWGAVLSPIVQVAGFRPHGFRESPARGLKEREAWTIERLELVSLLKFDEPRVYVLDHLPRMDQLAGDDVATRPLDEFEADSLEKLWADEDEVVAEAGNHVRMLGSLRAAKQCLDCHSVERGELLGAFSYVLVAGDTADRESIERPKKVNETVDIAGVPAGYNPTDR
jgi:hypothetical protein